MTETQRPLKVFLSYASQDKPLVRELSRRLVGEGWIDTWLDEKSLLPGQDWRVKIEEAVEESDIVIICLSNHSVSKEGHVQKELRYAREIALEKPEDAIFLIPLRLDECEVPRGLRFYQWVDYFGEKKDNSYSALVQSLKLRYEQRLKLEEAERAYKEKQEREAAEKLAREKEAREKAERDAIEKARLEAEEQARQKAAKEKNEREAAERAAQEKAAREKAEQEAREKVQREADAIAKQKPAKHEVVVEKEPQVETRLTVEEKRRQKGVGKISKPNTAIVVALIGFAGTVVAALLSSPLIEQWISAEPTSTPTITLTVRPLNATEEAFVSKVAPSPAPQTATSAALLTQVAVGDTQIAENAQLPTEITDAKGVSMVLVSAGEFIMGSEVGADDEEPIHNIYLDAFYIDKFEVTNTHYKECVDGKTCQLPDYLIPHFGTTELYFGNPSYDNYPVIFVDWYMAKSYCEWRGGRLPTEAEWEKTARGVDGRAYPWGENIGCDYSNYDYCNEGVSSVGMYEKDISIFGAYDMFGNVKEWVSSLYQPYPYDGTDGRENLSSDGNRIVRGVSWAGQHAFYNVIRLTHRFAWDPSKSDNTTGFRCAKDANP